ncbi:MAG: hypothetical protein R3E12_20095, partial [Candidatus Eisenbacteria bacterium]
SKDDGGIGGAAAGSAQAATTDPSADASTEDSDEAYHEQRTTLALGPGESRPVRLECDFEPTRILVDPDAKLLQLRRESAQKDL